MKQFLAVFSVVAAIALPAHSQVDTYGQRLYHGGHDEAEARKELETALPGYPRPENLTEIYVSAATTNKFLIDGTTLVAGKDGIVRYALVVETSGGARNVTFEGMDCLDHRWKIYATGRHDGTWTPSRNTDWRPIENKPVNRHHAAIYRDLFCPNGGAILSGEEGARALKLGKHPAVN